MRYKSFLQNNKWHVYKVESGMPVGSPLFSHEDKVEADKHIRSLLPPPDKTKPRRVVTRIAATNEPALPLNRHQMELVTIGEREYVRVPALIQGKFEDPRYGNFTIDQSDYDDIEESHILGVTDGPVYLRVGHQRSENLAYFDLDRGGFVREEEVNGDKVLAFYGVPTVPEITKEKIKLYGHASVDYHRKWKSSSTGKQLEEPIVFDDRILLQEEAMLVLKIGDLTISYEIVDGKAVIKEEDLEKLKSVEIPEDKAEELAQAKTELEEANAKLDAATGDKTALEAKVVKLEEKVKKLQPEPEVPEAVRIALEEAEERHQQQVIALEKEIQTRKRNERTARIKQIISTATARVDSEGRRHSPAVLELCESILTLKPLGSGADVIKLETPAGHEEYEAYMADAIEYLLENVLPGTVPTQKKTTSDDGADPYETNPDMILEEGEAEDIWKRNFNLVPVNGKEAK